MKKDWTYKKFEDCIENVKYTTKIQSKDYMASGEYPIISQEEELVSGYWNKNEDVFSAPRPLVVFGDHTRVLKYIDFDFVLGADGVKILLPIEDLEAKFLYYFLKWYNVPNLGYSRHYKLLKEISIPIPPLSIQRSIVAELDLLHSVISKKKEQLRELDNLAQSLFYQMFGDPITNPMGWEIKKLGEVALEKLSYGSGASAIDFDNEVRYVRITDINDDGSLNENAVSPSVCEDKYLLHCGDILFARTGATVGKTYLHLESAIKCIYAGYLIRFIPNKEIINPLYAFHFTKTRYYHDFVAQSQRAVAQPNINAQQYSNLFLPLPPLSLQQSFAAKVSAIEAQKQAVQQSIREVETLLAERMDNYFS